MRLKIAIAVLALAVAAGGMVDRQAFVAHAQEPAPSQVEARTGAPRTGDARTGDVVVKFKDGTTLAGVGAALTSAEAAPVQATQSGVVLLEPEAGQSVDDAVAALSADPNVLYAEPDALVSIDATPNDTYYGGYQAWHFNQINAPAAWDAQTGSTGTVIAIVDTGVQTTHTDLNGNVVSGANFVRVPIGSSSNSGGQVRITTTTPHPYLNGEQVTISGHSVGSVNGTWTISMPAALNIASSSVSSGTITVTTSTAHGLSVGEFVMVRDHSIGGANGQWTITAVPSSTQFQYSCSPDCPNGSGTGGVAKQATWFNLSGSSYSSAGTGGSALNTSPRDDEGHGTSVAGFAAAESNNGEGVAAVCWTCKIMPVKVLGATGSGSGLDVADGIEWAVDNGADVINLSLSSPSPSTPMLDAVNYAWNNGVIVVAASGNDGDTLDPSVRYPAKYGNAIAVGATNSSALRASFSNYGPELDIMAPGEGVTSTSVTGFGTGDGWYATGSGTSFATPHVAGVIGLMISHGITDKTAIVSALTSTAVDAGTAGPDNFYGHGIVDVAAALGSEDTTPPTVAITSPADGATVSGTVTISATASDASGIEKVRFWAGNKYLGYDTSAPFAVPWDTGSLLNGPYRLRIQGFDTSGNTSMEFIDVSLVNTDTVPPTVSITNPVNATGVSGTVNITAAANDALGLQKVQFWAGSSYLGYDTKAPFSVAWDTTSVADGGVFIRARAIDWAGNWTDAAIGAFVANSDSTPPTVAVAAPLNGAVVSGLMPVSALPTDDVAVQKVQFWVDGTYLGYEIAAPWEKTFDTTGLSNGPHLLTTRAWDWNGNASGYVSVGVVVSNGDDASPTVTIDSPSSSSVVSGVVNIDASAADDGGVQKVQFWFGPVYLGYDASSPYGRALDTTALANGTYSIRVRAVDWSGNTSDYVADVTVSN